MITMTNGLGIISGVLLILIAISFTNEKLVKLPSEIGLMTIAFFISIVMLILEKLNITSISTVVNQIQFLDIHEIILDGFLCFLLFSGSAKIRFKDLTHDKLLISSLAFISTLIATLIYGVVSIYIAKLVGVHLTFIQGCILGSIISPTDPISAMSILKKAGLPERLSLIMEGESLFNDGIAVALFITFTTMESNLHGNPTYMFVKIVGWNILGALLVGGLVSYLLFQIFKRTTQKHLEVIVSLAAVTSSYSISEHINVSGPTAAVVVGILFATEMNKLHHDNEIYYANFYTFWKVIDKLLNGVLFILIGIAALLLHSMEGFVFIAVTAILLALVARYISILGPINLFSRSRRMKPDEYVSEIRRKDRSAMAKLLTWSGLKGGICIALALGTKNIFTSEQYNFVVTSTYAVVLFSTLVQGLTVRKVYDRLEEKLCKK